jgi:uncharacterized protein (TIGR03083 family)
MAGRDVTADDVRRATDRFAAGLADADPAARVPACPGWAVADLVAHLGNVHAWAARVVETAERAETPDDVPDPGDLESWYRERAAGLVAALEAADPDAPCWNFSGANPTKGFWPRRQTHETLMHLVDLDQAHGRRTALDPEQCADGVSEVFEVFGPRMFARGFRVDLDATVGLVAADTGDRWALEPDPGGPPRLHDPATPPPDRLEGTARQLWQLLWKRADEGVTRAGDADRLARFLASSLTP